MKKFLDLFARLNIVAGSIILIFSIGLLILFLQNPINYSKSLGYNPSFETELLSETDIIKNNASDWNFNIEEKNTKLAIPSNTAVTNNFTIKINSIGVETVIFESLNGEKALNKGVWRSPYSGTPDNNFFPIILSAHRWGYETYTDEFRARNLFLNLPNINIGDFVIINWNNKEYRYKVTELIESTQSEKTSDLILITCKHFNSPVRYFVYASLV